VTETASRPTNPQWRSSHATCTAAGLLLPDLELEEVRREDRGGNGLARAGRADFPLALGDRLGGTCSTGGLTKTRWISVGCYATGWEGDRCSIRAPPAVPPPRARAALHCWPLSHALVPHPTDGGTPAEGEASGEREEREGRRGGRRRLGF
jgi:hypothetical protein